MGRRENPLKRHDTTHIHDNMMPEKIFTLNWHSTACACSSSFTWRATWLSLSCATGLSRRESIRLTWVRDRRETSEMEFLQLAVLSRVQWNAPTIWRLNSFSLFFVKANLRTFDSDASMSSRLCHSSDDNGSWKWRHRNLRLAFMFHSQLSSRLAAVIRFQLLRCWSPIDDDVLLTSAEISSNFLFTLI